MTPQLTARELEARYWLALTAYREARGEGAIGMLAVMQVIMERVFDRRGRWPDTVPAVCLQPKQFSCFNPGDPNSAVFLDGDTLALEFAETTLRRHVGPGHGLVFPNRKPNHYHAAAIDPGWNDEMRRIGECGRHEFWEG